MELAKADGNVRSVDQLPSDDIVEDPAVAYIDDEVDETISGAFTAERFITYDRHLRSYVSQKKPAPVFKITLRSNGHLRALRMTVFI